MVRSSLYRKLGGLDERFFAHMEEIDLCWRMQLEGYKVTVIPQSVVYHVGGGTLPASSPFKLFQKVAGWVRRKADKNIDKIQKFGFWGVCFFVAIPLPMTGAWTGSLVAATIHMKFWRAMLSAFLGVLIAGAIVTLICFGIDQGVSWLSFLV